MAIAAYNSQVLLASRPSVAFTNEATSSTDLTTYTVTNSAHRYFDPLVAVVVQTSPDGTTWTPVTTGFTLYRCTARVVFAVAQAVGTQVRFASGNYLPYATLAQAATCEFAPKMGMVETTVFNSSGNKLYTPTLLEGTLKYSGYWISNARIVSLLARDLLIVSFVTSTGNRYEGYCFAGDLATKADTKGVITEDLTFQLTNEFFNA